MKLFKLLSFGKSKENKIVDLFEKHLRETDEARKYFVECGNAALDEDFKRVEELSKKISESEHNADDIRREIRRHLHQGAFMPLMRTSMYDFSDSLDDVADTMQDVANTLGYLKGKKLPKKVKQIYKLMIEEASNCVIILGDLVKKFFDGSQDIVAEVRAAKVSEHKLDVLKKKVFDEMLFNSKDAILVWLLTDIASLISGIGDSIEECSDKIAVLKLMRQ